MGAVRVVNREALMRKGRKLYGYQVADIKEVASIMGGAIQPNTGSERVWCESVND